MLTLQTKVSVLPKLVFQNMRQEVSGPDTSNGLNIKHVSEGWGFEFPSGRDTLCIKNFDSFKRTSIQKSK